MTYVFKAVSFRTGAVVADLPLTAVSGQVHVDGGRLTADLPLAGRELDECREYLNATTPDLFTILAVRDGVIMGEWMIWTRDRDNSKDPVKLGGVEVRSWFEHVAVDGWVKRINADALTVAHDLAALALNRPPGIDAMTVDAAGTSGNVIPEADYPTGTNHVGKIMDELGQSINGFDWWVDTQWDTTAATVKVKRTVRFGYPRRGRVLQALIDLPRVTPGQSGVKFGLTEDGTKVATAVYMTGTGEGESQLVSRGLNSDLFATYPVMDRIESMSDYGQQKMLDAMTSAMAAASRSPELPTTVTLKANGDLGLGSFQPGDVAPAKLEACENFPDGYTGAVRILGYTMAPPADGLTETVDVEITKDNASVFDA